MAEEIIVVEEIDLVKSFKPSEWFQEITGVPEAKWQYGKGKWTKEGFINSKTNEEQITGDLFHHSLRYLRQKYAPKSIPSSVEPIILCSDVDIREVMINPKSTNDMFLIESRYNSLQNKFDQNEAWEAFFADNYKHVMTPASAIACRDDTTDVDDDSGKFSQCNYADINYLAKLDKYFKVHTGYIEKFCKDLPASSEERRELAGDISVVYQRNCQVVWDVRDDNMWQWLPTPVNVHQVHVSTTMFNQRPSLVQRRFLLTAAYESAYLAARACKAKALWLSLLLDNSYQDNPLDMVMSVINNIHRRLGDSFPVYLLDTSSICDTNKYGELVPAS